MLVSTANICGYTPLLMAFVASLPAGGGGLYITNGNIQRFRKGERQKQGKKKKQRQRDRRKEKKRKDYANKASPVCVN